MKKEIKIAQVSLPPIEEYMDILSKSWNDKWITNNGELHKQLEYELKKVRKYRYRS